ncbi:Methyltransferase domain-containing protein [Desulfonatronum thiosulfatophilum]|uniref:Methyltransferase domain-containing protein n=1 Tax=Desulfonatronum thiosulfatophilum TaxID=617002 RepID=A0A1G6EC41_9BACT|nr:class I SAM-dependent methyltransferase [Desulfonatronum thiosulfatophilum]SDB54900.1 Methyltransferase domain-containing protein [Desulfonatronum thiosulfatophilum]
MGFAVDRQWLDSLALHTQVVIKKSRLNWQHGRLLYATLRQFLHTRAHEERGHSPATILETGMARGFSAVCMARAMIDAGCPGTVLTLDILPHNTPLYWNCIDDLNGKKTRSELLSPWSEELERIIFTQGWTKQQLLRTGLSRIHFAYLDAQHTLDDVLAEYVYVRDRQGPGDMIVFDDVTPGLFDGVVQAAGEIENQGLYRIARLKVSGQRGYAVAVRAS